MATVGQVGQEGDFWAGLATSGRVPERFLKRGMDRLGQMSWVTRGTTRFLGNMHARFPKAKIVNSREHRVYELSELDRTIPVTVPSTSTNNHTTFGIPNRMAAQFQPNDVFHVKGLYSYVTATQLYGGQVIANNTVPSPAPDMLGFPTGTQPTALNYSRTFGPDNINAPTMWFTEFEQMLITEVGAPDSAAVGSTLITVKRAFYGGGRSDWGGSILPTSIVNTGVNTGNAGAILVDDVLLRASPSWPTGTGPARGFHKNPELDNNFTQQYKYAVEIEKELSIEATWHGKDPLEINRMLRVRQIALDEERRALFGRKGKTTDRDGKLQYMSGGLIEFVPQDTNHIHTYSAPAITYPGLLDFGDAIFQDGGSETRELYCGISLYNKLMKSFWDSGYLRYDEDASKAFELPVQSLMFASGKWTIHPLFTLQESGWANRGILMDPGYPQITPVTHEDWDMKIEKDIQTKGDQIYKEQWVGISGYERRYSQYLHIVNFE